MAVENAIELRVPLGVLAPSVDVSVQHHHARIAHQASDPSMSNSSQRMAVCEETGLVAIANGRVVDLYHTGTVNLVTAANDTADTIGSNTAHHQEAHLPFAGQIVLCDHVDSGAIGPNKNDNDDTAAIYATCVHFAASGYLLIAATTMLSREPSSWLFGFRMYARTVTVNPNHGTSSLLVHCSFVDQVPKTRAIRAMQPVPKSVFTSRDAGAVVVLFHDDATTTTVAESSSWFGVFQWAERFSDRVLSMASPHSLRQPAAVVLSSIATTADGQWVAICDNAGAVFMLDFRRFPWQLNDSADANAAADASVSCHGKRLPLGASFRMGRAINAREDHPLAAVRLSSEVRPSGTGAYGTSLRWWMADHSSSHFRAKRYLFVGQSDGALAVMALAKRKDEYGFSYSLQTIAVYPPLRSLKNDPVVLVTAPEYHFSTREVGFSSVSSTSWRRWTVQVHDAQRTPNGKTKQLQLTWPTLQDSLGLPMIQFGQHAAALFGWTTLAMGDSIASRLTALVSSRHQSSKQQPTSWLLLLTRDALRAIARVEKQSTESVDHQSVASIRQEAIPSGSDWSEKGQGQGSDTITKHEQDETTAIPPSQPAATPGMQTLQDRYKLPPMASSSSSVHNGDRDDTASQRLTKDQYNQRLAKMAHRVDRLGTNLHGLRHSFQLFTDDIQRHMMFINEQLEQQQQLHQTATSSIDQDSSSSHK